MLTACRLLTPSYNEAMARLTKLKRAYDDYNDRYFGGKLPDTIKVKWSRTLPGHGRWLSFAEGGIIEIAAWQRKYWMTWNLTLLHEMAHVATDHEIEEHGPKWHREMRRLARSGAFDKIW